MLSPRDLRRVAARILPEAVKGRLRARLFGYRESGAPFDLRVEPDGEGVSVATIDGELRMRMTPEVEPDVRYHFQENGESVDEMRALLRASRETPGTLFDVGAHHGLFSHLYCLAGGGNRAVAYEPSPVLLEGARRISSLNALEDRTTFRLAAVGAEVATLPGWTDAGGLIAFGQAPDSVPQIDVEMTTLDAEVERLGIVPQVVKVDVEGYEGEVLQGARRLLAKHRPLLFLEMHLDWLEKRGVSARGIVEDLRSHGYRFESLTGRPLEPAAVYGSASAVLRLLAR